MKIYVGLKRVPHTAAKIRLQPPEGSSPPRSIQMQGVELSISPYDEIALAEALKLKEKTGPGEVIAVSMGPDDTQTILRTALAIGADSAVLLRTSTATGLELDGFQVASTLAEFFRARPHDLLIFGRLATDDQSSQVGVLTARLLGLPVVADVTRVEPGTGSVRLHHQIGGRVEVVECGLPAAFTAQKGLAEAPYPSIKQIMAAKKKTLEVVDVTPPEPVMEILGLELPPPRKPGRIVGEGVAAVPELVRLLREEARVL